MTTLFLLIINNMFRCGQGWDILFFEVRAKVVGKL